MVKQKFSFLVLFVLIFNALSAQDETVIVKNGALVDGDRFRKNFYFLPDFGEGDVKLKDGKVLHSIFNINVYKQVLHAISNGKDTIAVDIEPNIEYVTISGKVFRKLNGVYYQLIATDGRIILALRKDLRITNPNKNGAYGSPGETASVTNINVLGVTEHTAALSGNVNYKFSYSETLSLMTARGMNYQFNKKNFLKLFSAKQADLEAYIKENKTDFQNPVSLTKMFNYVINLK